MNEVNANEGRHLGNLTGGGVFQLATFRLRCQDDDRLTTAGLEILV